MTTTALSSKQTAEPVISRRQPAPAIYALAQYSVEQRAHHRSCSRLHPAAQPARTLSLAACRHVGDCPRFETGSRRASSQTLRTRWGGAVINAPEDIDIERLGIPKNIRVIAEIVKEALDGRQTKR